MARTADARDFDAVRSVVADGVGELGGLDIVVANQGITGIAGKVHQTQASDWRAVLDTNLTGIWHVAKAGIQTLVEQGRGGSVVLTSSAVAYKAVQNMGAYTSAKHAVVGLMRVLAQEHAHQMIRVNTVNPTAVATPMVLNDNTYRIFRPDLEAPTAEDCMDAFRGQNLLPIPWVEAVDVANAVLFLASDEARYVTGVALPVDAGNAIT